MNVNFMLGNHLLHQLAQYLYDADFEYVVQLFTAFIPMSLTVVIHGTGMDIVRRYFKKFGQPLLKSPHRVKRSMVMVSVVGIMLVTHFVEIYMWGVFYLASGLLASIKHAMYFSMEAYSTLGASNIVLTGRWLGFDGFEAMTGMMMFGWSTALLAALVFKLHSVDD
jgi:hypothetical protein